MNLCLWCDAPCGKQKLCAECKAVNDHPPFHCQAGLGHLPTLGDHCCECALEAARVARVREQNAPAIESNLKCLRDLVAEIRSGKKWPGCEFGKAIMGNIFVKALRDLGCPEEQIDAALRRT